MLHAGAGILAVGYLPGPSRPSRSAPKTWAEPCMPRLRYSCWAGVLGPDSCEVEALYCKRSSVSTRQEDLYRRPSCPFSLSKHWVSQMRMGCSPNQSKADPDDKPQPESVIGVMGARTTSIALWKTRRLTMADSEVREKGPGLGSKVKALCAIRKET